jgi:hypothetical protein
MCLKDPVDVTREVTFYEQNQVFEVSDLLSCKQAHKVEQFWHFSEVAKLSVLDDNVLVVANGPATVRFTFDPRLSLVVESGNSEAPCGWVSRSFDCKVPGNTLIASVDIESSITLKTKIETLAD